MVDLFPLLVGEVELLVLKLQSAPYSCDQRIAVLSQCIELQSAVFIHSALIILKLRGAHLKAQFLRVGTKMRVAHGSSMELGAVRMPLSHSLGGLTQNTQFPLEELV